MYPHHEKIILAMDSLNAHALASLYKCFPAAEAHSYAKNLEIHYSVICRKIPGYFTRIFITLMFHTS